MGLWSGIKYAVNSSLGGADFRPLDTMISEVNDNIYIQTLLQNLNNATMDWVFMTAPNLGRVLNKAFALNNAALNELNTLNEIITDSTAMEAVMASSAAMDSLWSSEAASNTVINNSTAMAAIAASTAAMKTTLSHISVMTKIEASTVAKNALGNSPLKQTASYPATNGLTVRRSGAVFLISFRQSQNGNNTGGLGNGTFIIGNPTLGQLPNASYNRDYIFNKFASNISNDNTGSSPTVTSMTYTFIPLT